MIIWSTMFIPIIFPVLLSLWVISKSCWLGVGSPLGWLWISSNDAVDSLIAGIITSLGWTMLAFRLPSETVIYFINWSLGSRSTIFTIPFFRFFKKGEKYSKKTRLDFIFIFFLKFLRPSAYQLPGLLLFVLSLQHLSLGFGKFRWCRPDQYFRRFQICWAGHGSSLPHFFLHISLQTLLKFRANVHRTCYCYHILSVAPAVARLLANLWWKLSFFLAYHFRKNWSVA